MAKQQGNSGGKGSNSGGNKGGAKQQGNSSVKPSKANESFKGVGRPPKSDKK